MRDYALNMIGFLLQDRLRMVRYGQFKYWVKGNEQVLFDLAADPAEEHNLAGGHEALSEMRYRLATALIAAEDPCPLPG